MKKYLFSTVLFGIGLLLYITIISIWSIRMNIDCNGRLNRAANANTIELAKSELDAALNYLEARRLTNGYTSVLWKTPANDISFWYNNLKSSQNELSKLPLNTSPLEKSNLLLKLRDSLTDSGSDGTKLICPSGISNHPYNRIVTIFGFVVFVCFCVFGWLWLNE